MSNSKDSSSVFWIGFIVAAFMYTFTDSYTTAAIAGLFVLVIGTILKKTKQREQVDTDSAKGYSFDFDSLNPSYKSQLLKQQFSYFFKYISAGNESLEYYCEEDELDGYRFSFWVEYLIDSSSPHEKVKINKNEPICIIYISSNKGKSYGYEKFTINAPVGGFVTGFLKGTLQKGLMLFRIKEEKIVRMEETIREQEISPKRATVFFEDVVNDLSVVNGNIEVEKLDDVLRWEMPDVNDIEMPSEKDDNSAYDTTLAYHATITNLSDFEWCDFKAVCYSSTDDTQIENRNIGNVKIGSKTLLSSRFDMFYLEGENMNGEKRRFRPFALEKDGDITVTTIFMERL